MIASPKSLKVLKELLKHDGISQMELAKKAGVSIGLANKVVKKLAESYCATSERGSVSLRDHNRLFTSFSVLAPMQKNLYLQLVSPVPAKETISVISSSLVNTPYAFTLLAALPLYSSAAEGEKVSLYVKKELCKEAETLLRKTGFSEKNSGAIVELYSGNEGVLYDLKASGGGKYVSREQLILDLYSSTQYNYVARQLLEEYLRSGK